MRAELRGRGYGRSLLAAAEAICRERGVVAVTVEVPGGANAAHALLASPGLAATAVLMEKPLG